MPVYVLASVVSVAVNVSLRMHVCIGYMPGVERLAKQPYLHACTYTAPGSATCARHLHWVENWITFGSPVW